jgi:hypothetical protein
MLTNNEQLTETMFLETRIINNVIIVSVLNIIQETINKKTLFHHTIMFSYTHHYKHDYEKIAYIFYCAEILKEIIRNKRVIHLKCK